MDLPKASPAVSVDGAMFNILDREQCVWSERTMKEKKKRQVLKKEVLESLEFDWTKFNALKSLNFTK